MRTLTLTARLLRSPTPIPADTWFLVFPDDSVRLATPAEVPAEPLALPSPNRPLTLGLRRTLTAIAAAGKPINGRKLNASGNLSALKKLGYVSNVSPGYWQVTPLGLAAKEEFTQ